MAQNTVLAAGTTSATSTDIVVAAGSVVTVGIFTDTGDIPVSATCIIKIDTPGADLRLKALDVTNPITVLSGPCTARVTRENAGGKNIGVFTET